MTSHRSRQDADHPITPPPELVRQLWVNTHGTFNWFDDAVIQAARWGADQELEACCEWIVNCKESFDELDLHNARRPKPPSLKEQAMAALQEAAYMADDIPPQGICSDQIDTIRRAL